MESTVETLSPTRVRIAIEVPFAELEKSVRKAYRDINAQVTVPGFRKGKVPSAVIDQRIGRERVLHEAVQEAIPEQIVAAVQKHEVRILGRPEVEITQLVDGQPLRFTAEVDIRPSLILPDLSEITVTVDELAVSDEEVDAQLEGLRRRFGSLRGVDRPAQTGDFVQVDIVATVDGTEVPGTRAANLSHEIGSGRLMPGLDEALLGMAAGGSTTFSTELAGGDYQGRQAEVSLTLRTVKELDLPSLDDEFAQQASEFDTLAELRDNFAERLRGIRRIEQLYSVRDRALTAVIDAAGVPAPHGLVRDQMQARKEVIDEQVQRAGGTVAQLLAERGTTQAQFDQELTEEAEHDVRTQLLLDAFAEAETISVSEEEYGHEIMHRAERAGMAAQQYYDKLVREGADAVVYGDLRRGKALTEILQRVTIVDTAGNRLTLDELQTQADPSYGEARPDDEGPGEGEGREEGAGREDGEGRTAGQGPDQGPGGAEGEAPPEATAGEAAADTRAGADG